jgi:hypothetical protein
MKKVVLTLFFVALRAATLHIAVARQQASVDDPVRTFPPIRISMASMYQQWTQDGISVNELSIPISAQLQPLPNLEVQVGVSQASAKGDGFEQVSGLTDLQVAFAYRIELKRVQLQTTLGLNVPTGTSQLSTAAYVTTYQLGQSQYNFLVPHFGQGASIAPGVAGVLSLTETLTLGAGLTLHLRDSFEPVDGLLNAYDWGNEYLFTAGAEWQANATLTVSTDALYTRYDADRIGAATIYEAGRRLMLQAHLQQHLGKHTVAVAVRYRDVGENRALVRGVLTPEAVRTFPGYARLTGSYGVRLTPALRATIHADGTRYEDAVGFEPLTVYAAGLAPEISLTPAIAVPILVRYSFGDLDGIEASLGLTAIF